jgi:hypothetical protein
VKSASRQREKTQSSASSKWRCICTFLGLAGFEVGRFDGLNVADLVVDGDGGGDEEWGCGCGDANSLSKRERRVRTSGPGRAICSSLPP